MSDAGGMVRLDERVTSLGAFRVVGQTGRNYPPTGTDAPTAQERHRSVEHIFRMAAACGMIGEHRDGDYAVLDGWSDGGEIVADYGIRDVRGFRFLYRKLNWRLGG